MADKEENVKFSSENDHQQEKTLRSDETDTSIVHHSSSGGFIVSKPDPGMLSTRGPHTRHNYRSGGGGREQYQRQPTLPSLPELEDNTEALEGEEEEGRDGRAAKELDSQQQQRKLLTTL